MVLEEDFEVKTKANNKMPTPKTLLQKISPERKSQSH